jgi:hypothetical protein
VRLIVYSDAVMRLLLVRKLAYVLLQYASAYRTVHDILFHNGSQQQCYRLHPLVSSYLVRAAEGVPFQQGVSRSESLLAMIKLKVYDS